MARKPRPGRTLVVFFLGMALLYGLVVLAGTWKPALGLDLQGGTRITLVASDDDPADDSLEQARQIIDDRVNGSGVAEADVVTEGSNIIVVEIPGSSRRDLLETVKRQAQLRFRLVACSEINPGPCAAGGGQGPALDPGATGGLPDGSAVQIDPGTGGDQGGDGGNNRGNNGGNGGEGDQQGSNNRPPVGFATKSLATADATASPSAEPSEDTGDGAENGTDEGTEDPSGSPSPSMVPAPDGGKNATDPLTWVDAPNEAAIKAYNEFTCPADGTMPPVEDNPDKPLVSCETFEDGTVVKYLLSPSAIEGTQLTDASAQIPQQQVQWVVALEFNGAGTKTFADISRKLVNNGGQFAVVLDGEVLSAPTMNGLITNGQAQIEGNFTEASAQSLATSLKFGALPIAFQDDVSSETIGPSLAGDQLSAGLWAGGLGLALVMLYCLVYYRGLGVVVLGSLAVAALITYALVLLLSETAGFTLTLPGIAGLIIAVGVTADSFILFFERIRDEMREGKSMRVAVETGWKRAKVTRLAANTVSLLSAAVLYIFATGAVKGFGFALGLSTLIDLAVLFWFTKPAVSYLARYKFFNGGGRLSGLSPETLGMDRVPAGGNA
ncbi:protein translocase subunit SecD [Nocardioides sp. IC4_145]|uniref:protein translocase subunit SecD n=1 Tax=Nocardioides sp. IC4_145 TaxID=2714037 RepID=UPI00140C3A37|nr:protein translocase subunit SecD [Nocardioides sp. IC4_145]NHC22097.1 protein translocase subunit SecD [Nocardioides sp. IC4_145]